MRGYDFIFLGLSITSSWGNGHATTYRGLLRHLAARGHRVLFLERDLPYYASNRDLAELPYGELALYTSLGDLRDRFAAEIRDADVVVVGSFVPEGVAIGRYVADHARGARVFYDIDTPVTLGKLERGEEEYLSESLIRDYDLYLSFTSGPVLSRLRDRYGARMVRALHCSVDPAEYYPESVEPRWDLGYLGTYSKDRQGALDGLLSGAARAWPDGRFVVAGAQYPADSSWPGNVERTQHVSPREHRGFYAAQRFTLNLTRGEMMQTGYSPSIRLFEAAACGTPIISDDWPGLEDFFTPGSEVLVTHSAGETLSYIKELSEEGRALLAARARRRVLAEHTSAHRAEALEGFVRDALDRRARRNR